MCIFSGETGTKVIANGVPVLMVEGWYSYIGDDGREYKVSFISNQFGYMPSAQHIPESGTWDPSPNSDAPERPYPNL